jgi:uncharacterized surface protein with fasciclin (FAS1) repeats
MATGTSLWESGSLVGSCSGTPVVGSDGSYVYLTHSEDVAGTFSILGGADGSVFYQATDDTQPLSPPGIYHNPSKGPYEGGEFNRNDVVVWGNKPIPGETGVLAGSASYAFQLPDGLPGSNPDPTVVTLLADTDFQADAPPLITDDGQSMYWGVSRNAVVAWPSRTFDRDPGGNKVSFSPRGNPASRPVIAKIASSRGLADPIFYTGSAANHFAAIDLGLDDLGLPQIFEKWTVTTGSPIYTEAQVSPDDVVVYTIEELGTVHAIDAATGTINWSNSVQGFIRASAFAQSASGDAIYFADTDGIVHAWKVAEGAPTAPVAPPLTMAPVAPTVTMAPVAPVDVTVAPVTMAPVGPVDVSVAPVTMAPVPVAPLTVLDLVLAQDPPLSTLVGLATNAELAGALADPGLGSTVFAPTDAAFANSLDADYLVELATPEWKYHAECYVASHLGVGLLATTDMYVDGQVVMNGAASNLTLGANPPSVNSIPISDPDKVADNGVLQVIDQLSILASCVTTNIFEAGSSLDDFSTLISLVQKTGIANALSTQRPLTLFAPTNAAFAALPTVVTDYLLDDANVDELRNILFYHLVRTNLYLDDAEDAGMYTTTLAQNVTVTMEGEEVFSVNGVAIVDGNGLFQNGIVHSIGSVLVPPGFVLPSVAPAAGTPITMSPVTMAPGSMTPVAPTAPVTMAPVTIAPVTMAPVTMGPVTMAPVTPAPAPDPTSAPTTAPPTSSAATSGMIGLVAAVVVGFFL